MAPAHPHATSVAVYPALFICLELINTIFYLKNTKKYLFFAIIELLILYFQADFFIFALDI